MQKKSMEYRAARHRTRAPSNAISARARIGLHLELVIRSHTSWLLIGVPKCQLILIHRVKHTRRPTEEGAACRESFCLAK